MRDRSMEGRLNRNDELRLGYQYVVSMTGIVHKALMVKHWYGVDVACVATTKKSQKTILVIKRCKNAAEASRHLGEWLLDSPGLDLTVLDSKNPLDEYHLVEARWYDDSDIARDAIINSLK